MRGSDQYQVKLPEEFLHGPGGARLVIPRDEAGGFPLHLFQLVGVLLWVGVPQCGSILQD